jgi:uncharacterized protein (DUF983 family)
MLPACPRCGLAFERGESGYLVGAYMMNVVAAELVWVAAAVAVAVATWPDPPWDLLMYGGAALMVVTPVVLYPLSKTIFLAMDLAVRPPGAE